jgi:hypothetical protein
MKLISIKNSAVTNYWKEFYAVNGYCSLCGNNGIIDSDGTSTPNNIPVGRMNFCICPNGQSMRKYAINKTGDRQVTP